MDFRVASVMRWVMMGLFDPTVYFLNFFTHIWSHLANFSKKKLDF